MATKRKTKEQRDAEAKAALRQRLDDIFLGATGDVWDESGEPWPEQFMAFVRAVNRVFCVPASADDPHSGNEYLWGLWNLENYRTPETAAEYLFENNVRG
jgi:hypothetical protein